MDPSASPASTPLRCSGWGARLQFLWLKGTSRDWFPGVVEEKRSPAVWKKTMFLRPHKVWGPKCRYFSMAKNLELLKECAVILSFFQLFSIIVHVVTTVTLTGWQATDMWSCGASPPCLIRCSCAPMWSGHSTDCLGVLIRFWTARRSCTFCFAVILLSLETLMLESQTGPLDF